MASREIHTLDGQPFGSTRWTSTATTPAGRAPFAGRGLGACGCPHALEGLGVCPACAGLGAAMPPAGPMLLTVRNHVMSRGSFDPTRMVAAMSSVLAAQGLRATPKVSEHTHTWAWEYDGANKVYEAKLVGIPSWSSGGFAIAGRTPTEQDSANLPSHGTVISFEAMRVPASFDKNILLGELRAAKTTAARGSNATGGGELKLELVPDKKKSGAAGLGLFALVLAGLYFGTRG